MGKYWGKIAFRALVIFGVGMVFVSLFRSTKRTVRRVTDSNVDISIPLGFLPFQFDGANAGKFDRLVLHRSDPRKLSGVDLTIRVSDPAIAAKLAQGCNLTVDDPTRLNNHSSFRCVALDSAMEQFGTVLVQTKDADGDWVDASTVVLVIPKSVAADLRGHGNPHDVTNASREELQRQLRQLGDSIGALGRAMGQAKTSEERDSLKEAIDDVRSAIDDLNDQMRELNEAAPEAARPDTRAEAEEKVSISAGNVKVNVGAGGVKVTDGAGTKVDAGPGGVRVKTPETPKAPAPPKS